MVKRINTFDSPEAAMNAAKPGQYVMFTDKFGGKFRIVSKTKRDDLHAKGGDWRTWAKKDDIKKNPRKPRTAAQRAATARLVAMNKAKRGDMKSLRRKQQRRTQSNAITAAAIRAAHGGKNPAAPSHQFPHVVRERVGGVITQIFGSFPTMEAAKEYGTALYDTGRIKGKLEIYSR